MDEYTRIRFKDRCPYTDFLCIDNIPCSLCEVEQRERELFKHEDKERAHDKVRIDGWLCDFRVLGRK